MATNAGALVAGVIWRIAATSSSATADDGGYCPARGVRAVRSGSRRAGRA